MTDQLAAPFRILPAVTPETEPFWTGGRDGELRFLRCQACGWWLHPPGPVCPACLSRDLAVEAVSGRGTVHAFTLSGSWMYLEYPDDVNVAGSYLFEPAGSIHTLHVPEANTEVTDVFFTIHGANLNLDAEGNVTTVIDAGGIRDFYFAMCEADGHSRPPVIGT